jgi:hypothetical protein
MTTKALIRFKIIPPPKKAAGISFSLIRFVVAEQIALDGRINQKNPSETITEYRPNPSEPRRNAISHVAVKPDKVTTTCETKWERTVLLTRINNTS